MSGGQKIFLFKRIGDILKFGNTFIVHMTIEVFKIKSNKCQYKSQWNIKLQMLSSPPSSGRHQSKLMGDCVIFSVIVKKPPVASEFYTECLSWHNPKGNYVSLLDQTVEFSVIKQTCSPLCYGATIFSVIICLYICSGTDDCCSILARITTQLHSVCV